MKVTYKVISTITGNDLTDKESWVLPPNGRLAYNLYGDLIGDASVDAVFAIEGIEQKQGKWIERIETLTWCEDDVEVYYDCSRCGAHSPGESPYCPNCGSKMKFEEL